MTTDLLTPTRQDGSVRLDVLSVGRGHLKLTYDPDDAIERDRAERVITDMLRRGYALFIVDDDGTTKRVRTFDSERFEYIVDDTAQVSTAPPPLVTPTSGPSRTCRTCGTDRPVDDFPTRGRGRSRDCQGCLDRKQGTKRVRADQTKATAVGRSAGG